MQKRHEAEPDRQVDGMQRASMSVRLLSLLYETVLVAALLLVATAVFVLLLGDSAAQPQRLLLQFFLVIVTGIYFVWSWTGGRRTLPMRTWRLQLLDAQDRSPNVRSALTRYLVALVTLPLGGLPLLWALVDSERRFLHDRLAGTHIVREPPLDKPRSEDS